MENNKKEQKVAISVANDMFVKKIKGMKVFFIAAMGSKGIAYWRSLVPAKFLARAKFANTAIMFGKYTKEAVDWADVVVFQRVAGETIRAVAQYCRMTNTGILYDVDDDVFNYPNSPEYHEVDVDKVGMDILDVIELSDVVSVTEETLAEVLSEKTAKPIRVLPNSVDFEFWDAPAKKNYSHDDFIIGWAGGAYHLLDFDILIPVMTHILDKYKNIKFASIGAVPEELLKAYPDRVLFHKFMDMDVLPDFLHKMKFDIGLAPLWENKFNDSRSNIRVLQHSVLETPTIASDFGAYRRLKEANFPLITVPNKVEDWIAAIEDLISDKEKRKYLGQAARERTKFSFRAERIAPKWIAALREAHNIAQQ